MTPPMTPREKVAAFERYPALASWIAKMASVGSGLSLGEWMTFVGSLNAAIVQAEQRTALASGSGDHAELARLAEAATPGPWHRGNNDNGSSQGEMSVWPDPQMRGGIIARCGWQMPWDGWHEQPAKDAAFIAAANPATVLALLAENAALRAEIETLTTAGIIEVAVRNPSVADYVKHWEGRATEAERKLAEAVGHLTRLADWIEHEVGAELPYAEGETDARTFLNKEAERG